MKDTFITPDCSACFVDTALRFLKEGTDDPMKLMEGIARIFKILEKEFSAEAHTFTIGNKLAREISEYLKDEVVDIFKKEKDKSNELCMGLFPTIEARYDSLDDDMEKLYFALGTGVAGNVIDVGTSGHAYVLDDGILGLVDQVLENGFVKNDINRFHELVLDDSMKKFMMMLDNAGEIVFDKLLIKYLKEHGKTVTALVKGGPIANDATLEDAMAVGIDKICDKVITTSIPSLGYTLTDNEQDVRDEVDSMDVIVGKGQANLETLSTFIDEIGAKHVFLLSKIKCPTVARFQEVPLGSNVFKMLR